jgi:hypothetical protein
MEDASAGTQVIELTSALARSFAMQILFDLIP